MAAQAVYTESQKAHADLLLSRSHAWTRATRKRDGLAFVIFPSSRRGDANLPIGYYTTESACTCRGYFYRGYCSHVLAVQREAEQAREAVTRRARYEDVFRGSGFELTDAF